MLIQTLNIDDVLIEESRFSLKGFVFGSNSLEACLEDSFRNTGVLYPVIVFMDDKGRLHLIDGKKRINFAKQNNLKNIDALIFTEAAPVTDIITVILSGKRMEIEQSVMNKTGFICFAKSLNAPEAWITESLCIPFGFKPHSEFLKDCEHINNLPGELKLFCHEKRFSMKQLLNLAYYPEDILLQLMAWKPALQLTASILDELASNLRDYLSSQDKAIRDFLDEPEVQEIFRSSLSSRDKTDRLRQLIHIKRFPILSETNAKLEGKVAKLDLPERLSINWDRSLENKNVAISVHVNDAGQLAESLKALNSDEMKKAVEDILNEL
ncbi:MAG: ParB N-terminal domain-containing protein [Nitrospirae bacterium]|nr:ParB N-terminal domain-containing protein [Nitrospirota bacterium]